MDECVCAKLEYNECLIISLYVDDILIFGSSLQVVYKTKSFLASNFEIEDIGEASVILGMKIISKRWWHNIVATTLCRKAFLEV